MEPHLAKPGDGIPLIERIVATFAIRWNVRSYDQKKITDLLKNETCGIQRMVGLNTPETLSQKVLIPRLRGLEDSSRNWSVFMTLEHLRIVNTLIAKTIHSLGHNQPLTQIVSTADVKPASLVDPTVIEAFSRSTEKIITAIDAVPKPTMTMKYPHPWFGPLNAAEWHFMSAFHTRLHHKQIKKILERQR